MHTDRLKRLLIVISGRIIIFVTVNYDISYTN